MNWELVLTNLDQNWILIKKTSLSEVLSAADFVDDQGNKWRIPSFVKGVEGSAGSTSLLLTGHGRFEVTVLSYAPKPTITNGPAIRTLPKQPVSFRYSVKKTIKAIAGSSKTEITSSCSGDGKVTVEVASPER